MQSNRYLGKFELGSIVFNLLIYRLFTSQPSLYPKYAGSAAWLLALLSGLLFLGILALLLRLYRPAEEEGILRLPWFRRHPSVQVLLQILLILIFAGVGISSLTTFVHVMQKISYPTSPFWFLAVFFLLGALAACLCGAKAVFRLHALGAGYAGLVLLVIAVCALGYLNVYHLTPVFGTGISMLKGIPAALFQYIDILLLLGLSPMKRKEVHFSRTVLSAAAAAVFVNVLILLIFCLHVPYEVGSSIEIPLYPLTKAVYFGKFASRLDVVYLTAFAVSSILYLSALLLFLRLLLQKLRTRLPKRIRFGKPMGAALLLLFCCFSLTSCFDNREVEESAYLIALGIDQGEGGNTRFTFQISNPLMTGKNTILSETTAEEENAETQKAGAEQAGNPSVNNLTVEAEDYYTAVEQLQSSLSKKLEMSHIKLIVFSAETAAQGLTEHAGLLLKEREVRPATSLCVAQRDAQTFLHEVNPSFEESTARYYELLFGNEGIPYSPTVELREFVNNAREKSADGVLPIADKGRILGMALFDNERMVGEVSGEDAMLYKLLTGSADHLDMRIQDATVRLTSASVPKIRMEHRQNRWEADISLSIKADTLQGNISHEELRTELTRRCTAFLQSALGYGCDLLGFGRRVKARCLTQQEWESVVKPALISGTYPNILIKITGK